MTRFSVFTPCHRPDWLGECHASLLAQSDPDWEWVIVANGHRKEEVLKAAMTLRNSDYRVKPFESDLRTIGGLKREACRRVEGRILVELDQDDILLASCLSRIGEAVDNGADFVYSDCLTFDAEGGSHSYADSLGWTFRRVGFRGTTRRCYRQFDVSPRSLFEIFYAPDHVRAWTFNAYFKAGRHDASMFVGDDHDLLCRTYLSGANMVRVDDCLYAYRVHPGNTSAAYNVNVREANATTGEKYLEPMVAEWCRRKGLRMIDLGGAHNPAAGYETLDRCGNPDILCDVRDIGEHVDLDSVGAFRAVDFLEHVPVLDVVPVMNQLYRRLADGGFLFTHTPAVCDAHGKTGRGAFQDPTHVSYWSPNNFWYFCDREYAKYVPDVSCRFQTVRKAHWYPSRFHEQNGIPYVRADLMAVKGDSRPPGELKI